MVLLKIMIYTIVICLLELILELNAHQDQCQCNSRVSESDFYQ